MAKKSKATIVNAFEWSSELLEQRILESLEISYKELEKANIEVAKDTPLPGRWVRPKVKDYKGRIKSLKTQIKKLKRGLGGVILTDPEYYKKTGLFRKITEAIGNPEEWTAELSEELTKKVGSYGGAMADTGVTNEFNPAGKVGHHRTALSTLREAIEPLPGDVRAEFKRLALRDGYSIGEEMIDYLDPAAHKRMNETLHGILANRKQKPSQELLQALTERSAHAAAFGGENTFAIPKSLIKEGANAEEVYRLAKPYLELQRRGAESGLQLDDILTSNRWNTNKELLSILEAEMPIQDTTPILNKMRVDLMDAGLMDEQGFRTPELIADRKASGLNMVSDRRAAGIDPDQMRANMWDVPDEVRYNASIIAERSAKATKFTKAATGLNKADSMVRFLAGDYVGGGLGLAMNSNAFRNAIAKRLTRAGSKLIPGVGIGMSALETAGYASQGRFTQAGIAALSGGIGEIPIIGDIFAGGLDLLNTGIDVATGNLMPDLDDPELGGIKRAAKYTDSIL